MKTMYKAVNIISKGFSSKEVVIYQTPYSMCIADYAFNNYMYRKECFSTPILDIAAISQKNVIQKPDGAIMSQKELNELIKEYYPEAVKKIKERESLENSFLGKKLVDFKLLAPWKILYLKMVEKEADRIDLLKRLYQQTTKEPATDKTPNIIKNSSLSERMAIHAEEVRKMPNEI